MSRALVRKKCRIKVGKTDTLTITMHSSYVHLKLISPGRQFFIQEIYIPRRILIPVLKWMMRAQHDVPLGGNPLHYVPDAVRDALAEEALISAELKAAKKKRDRKAIRRRQRA